MTLYKIRFIMRAGELNMTTEFRIIVMAHFIRHGEDDPIAYLVKRSSLKRRTIVDYLSAGNHPVESERGFSVQTASWFMQESRDVIKGDSPAVENQVENFLLEKLNVYRAECARKRKAKQGRRKAKPRA